jgi:hypothetical protein
LTLVGGWVGPRAGLDGFGEDIYRMFVLEITKMDQKLVDNINFSRFKGFKN